MYALIGRFYGTWEEGLYQVEDGMQFLLKLEEGRAIEKDACGGPIFFSEGAAHEARLRFRGHRLDWSGARFELGARVVELDTAQIRELCEHGDERATADEYRQAYTAALRLGEEWHERDPRRGEILPEFGA